MSLHTQKFSAEINKGGRMLVAAPAAPGSRGTWVLRESISWHTYEHTLANQCRIVYVKYKGKIKNDENC